jgi:hypothetical protein
MSGILTTLLLSSSRVAWYELHMLAHGCMFSLPPPAPRQTRLCVASIFPSAVACGIPVQHLHSARLHVMAYTDSR